MVQAPPSSPLSSSSASSSSSAGTPSRDAQLKLLNTPKVKIPLSVYDIGIALDTSVKALKRLGYAFCTFGSAGCAMYGMNNRCPHDVDIIVLTSSETAEQIKSRLVRSDERFILVPAQDPRNDWNVMWFVLPGPNKRRCKIDILTQGTINIPRIPHSQVVSMYGIPLPPFLCLLLLKLQAYFDHRVSPMRHMRGKIPEDEEDIEEMAWLGATVWGASVKDLGQEWYTSEFRAMSLDRVRKFAREHRKSIPLWEKMGFDLAEPTTPRVPNFFLSLQGLGIAAGGRMKAIAPHKPTVMNHASSMRQLRPSYPPRITISVQA